MFGKYKGEIERVLIVSAVAGGVAMGATSLGGIAYAERFLGSAVGAVAFITFMSVGTTMILVDKYIAS